MAPRLRVSTTASRSCKRRSRLLEKQSTPCSGHLADISDPEAVAGLVAEIDSVHGGFDGVVNNAGIMQSMTDVRELAIEEIQRITQVNYWGAGHAGEGLPSDSRAARLCPHSEHIQLGLPGALPGADGIQREQGSSSNLFRGAEDGAARLERRCRGGDARSDEYGNPSKLTVPCQPAKEKLQAFSNVPGIALTADRAAGKILSAVSRGRRRIVLGWDGLGTRQVLSGRARHHDPPGSPGEPVDAREPAQLMSRQPGDSMLRLGPRSLTLTLDAWWTSR